MSVILDGRSAFLRLAISALLLIGALAGAPGMAAAGGEHADDHFGYLGEGHAQWHETFYKDLKIPGSKTSCCNLADCRPTQVRTNGDHYEIMKDGRWIRVQTEKIVRIAAPDGGAHICAPASYGTRFEPDYVFCIVMPLES